MNVKHVDCSCRNGMHMRAVNEHEPALTSSQRQFHASRRTMNAQLKHGRNENEADILSGRNVQRPNFRSESRFCDQRTSTLSQILEEITVITRSGFCSQFVHMCHYTYLQNRFVKPTSNLTICWEYYKGRLGSMACWPRPQFNFQDASEASIHRSNQKHT